MGSTPTNTITIFSIIYILISNAVTLRRDKSILYSRSTMIILSHCVLVAHVALDLSFLAGGVGLFGGLFHATPMTQIFHIFLYSISLTIVQLTGFHPRKLWIKNYSGPVYIFMYRFIYEDTNIIGKMGQQFKIIEYPLILLFIITGGVLLMSSSDIVSIFLSIELQSYGLYLLATLYRNSELSTSAGLTYFLLGGLSSCFILLGTSLLYTNSGTTSLDGYYVITGISNVTNEYMDSASNWYNPLYLNISLLIMSVGFLFKISAAPFHFWSPDVYDAIPTIVTTFVAITAKISILVFLLELVHYTSNLFFSMSFSWTSGLLLSSFLSLIIGTVLGLVQTRIKRLFAYSTISHLGFMLLAITINKSESIQAFVFYLTQYSVSNLNAFVILIAIGYSVYPFINKGSSKEHEILPDRNNTPIQLTSELKGYFNLNPILAISLAVTLFSFAGIPPLAGFFAKQMVLSAALDSGYIFIAIIAILTSVISAAYYLNVIKQVFFDESELELHKSLEDIEQDCKITPYISSKVNVSYVKFGIGSVTLSTFLTITISVLTLIILLFMFASNEWLSMTRLLSLLMFNP